MCLVGTMVVVEGHEAFRRDPCKFWINRGDCTKGFNCPFKHPLEDGTDAHDYNVDPNNMVNTHWSEECETAQHEEILEAEKSEPVEEEAEETFEEEEEEDWGSEPHFGIFEGAEQYYRHRKYINCNDNTIKQNRKLFKSTPNNRNIITTSLMIRTYIYYYILKQLN